MTTKDMDIKLAHDIARIRMIVTGESRNTISSHLITAMIQLNRGLESEIAAQISRYFSSSVGMSRITNYYTESYIKAICLKLKIRDAVHKQTPDKILNFTQEDLRNAKEFDTKLASEAVDIIQHFMNEKFQRVTRNCADSTLISFDTIESASYDIKKLKPILASLITTPKEIQHLIAPDELFSLEEVQYRKTFGKTIEYREKNVYYGKWIFEHFQPVGVIKVEVFY